MEERISPEEKLLRLIKQRRGEPSQKGIKLDYTNKPEKVNRVPGKRYRSIKVINICLIILLLGLLCISVIDLTVIKQKPELPQVKEADLHRIVVMKEEQVPLNFYIGVFSRRNLFKVIKPPSTTKRIEKPRITLSQLLAGYTFVGILYGETPQVIVEDKKTRQTYYLSAGEYLGQIKIERIEEGKVTVSYGDETVVINI